MTEHQRSVPPANKISVSDPPEITYVELLRQVFDAINDQVECLDREVERAAQGDHGKLSDLYEQLHAVKTHAARAGDIVNEILFDSNELNKAVARLNGPGESLKKVKALVASVKELEHELQVRFLTKNNPLDTPHFLASHYLPCPYHRTLLSLSHTPTISRLLPSLPLGRRI